MLKCQAHRAEKLVLRFTCHRQGTNWLWVFWFGLGSERILTTKGCRCRFSISIFVVYQEVRGITSIGIEAIDGNGSWSVALSLLAKLKTIEAQSCYNLWEKYNHEKLPFVSVD